jgi:site-specific recombinase XerD
MQLSDFAKDYAENCRARNLSRNTLRAYEGDLRDFLRFAGPDALVSRCDRSMIRSYVGWQFHRGLSPATVRRRIACLRGFCKWLVAERVLRVSPFRDLELRVRLPRLMPRVFSHDEMGRLLSGAAGSASCDIESHSYRVALELLYATGIRVGELVSIRRGDVDLSARVIRIRGKGNKERRVYLPTAHLANLIRRYLQAHTNAAGARLLVTRNGRPATARHIRRWLRRGARGADVQGRVTPHMLRHTTATHLLENGLNLRYVQHLLGHENIATTQRYSHVNDAALMQAICDTHPLRSWRG